MSREADLEAECAVLRRENKRLIIQNRRLVDELIEAEEATRVYRRVAYRIVSQCDDCSLCDPRPRRTEP